MVLKVAVSTDGNQVSAHFGRCPEFTLASLEGGKISGKEVIPNPGHEPGRIPLFLSEKKVELIICGGMGMRAVSLFSELGIKSIVGVSGEVSEALDNLAEGVLEAGESRCSPGGGKGYGVEKSECSHPD